jgi:hypothetical protein
MALTGNGHKPRHDEGHRHRCTSHVGENRTESLNCGLWIADCGL